MSDLNQTIADLKLEVATLRTSNYVNQSQIDACAAAITALNSQVAALEAEITYLKAK